jgi:hypothetical protein
MSKHLPGDFFHGTKKSFADFQAPAKYHPAMQHGFGIHFTRDPKWAKKHYAEEGGTVHRVRLCARSVFDANAIHHEGTKEHEFAKDLYRGGKYRLVSQENPSGGPRQFTVNLDVAHPKKAERLLRKHGFDAVKYTARQTIPGHRAYGIKSHTEDAPSMIVLDPHQVSHVESGVAR